MFSSSNIGSRLVAAVSSVAISAAFFAFAIMPAIPNAVGSGVLV